MNLTPAMQNFILHWGEMGAKWGVNRSVAQIHALLHISPDPMTAEEICETLNLARSNVSTGLKELQGWKLVKASRKLGDRRDHFHSIRDMYDLVNTVVEGRREREYVPTLTAMQEVLEEAKSDGTPESIRARLKETTDVMAEFDRWYGDVSRLSRPVQKALLKLGGRVAKLIPGGKSQG
ncbi:GbsR/MarR family transcriptional regulator [Aliiroseovarius sp. YM-037]|uniref:GbsR/MarR family transcriptional regulator n=1 Tax=Aliiroseovarius sp. YM-037 TaxID=3341728 RepID=UPI003A7FD949